MFKRVACLLLSLVILLCSQSLAMADVYYELFLRAFADSNGDGIGDINGLIAKLDYLQDLGIKGLWLMPIFPSPSYHGYDISNYKAINSQYGNLEDFERLIAEAHKRDIKILLDIAFNHSSIEHTWFKQGVDKDNPYHAWYRWSDTAENPPSLDQKVWGHNVWNRLGNNYYYALFWSGMPDLNLDNNELRQELINISKYWLSKGIDGFRLDATSHIYATGEVGNQDIDRSSEFWQELYKAIKQEYPNAYIIGEAWEALDLRAKMLIGMDSVVNFDIGTMLATMLKMQGSGQYYSNSLRAIYKKYAQVNKEYVDSPFLSNHDQNRIFSALGYKLNKAKFAANLLLSLPGNPIIYYGEEIGMAGAKPDEELRTPMLWGSADGFNTNWYQSKYNKKTKSLQEQQQDKNSLFCHYKQLIALRNSLPALDHGSFLPYSSNNDNVLSYAMQSENQRLIVIHNFTNAPQALSLPKYKLIYSSEQLVVENNQVIIPAYSSGIWEQ